MAGEFCGSVSVAAVGATGSITGLLVNFFIGLSVGAGVAVAHGLGGREIRSFTALCIPRCPPPS